MDPTFLILIAVFGLMMWMMSRGAKKQRQAAANVRASLEPGQQVMTASGFYATIVDIDGDVITLESSPGVETMWKRDAIHAVTEPPFAVEDEDEDEETVDEDATGLAVPDDASSLTADLDAAATERDSAPQTGTETTVRDETTSDDETDGGRRA